LVDVLIRVTELVRIEANARALPAPSIAGWQQESVQVCLCDDWESNPPGQMRFANRRGKMPDEFPSALRSFGLNCHDLREQW